MVGCFLDLEQFADDGWSSLLRARSGPPWLSKINHGACYPVSACLKICIALFDPYQCGRLPTCIRLARPVANAPRRATRKTINAQH